MITEGMKDLYIYTTRVYRTKAGTLRFPEEVELEQQGWSRAWADVTTATTFVVYRRPFHGELERCQHGVTVIPGTEKLSERCDRCEDLWRLAGRPS